MRGCVICFCNFRSRLQCKKIMKSTHFCLIFTFCLLDLCLSTASKKCIQWTTKFVDHDGPSMVYTETKGPEDGIGSQLYVYAFLWTLRRFYNVDVFISRFCHQTLSRIFTEESLSDMPVLEDYFCNPEDIRFEYFSGNFQVIASKKEFRTGRVLWLWPSKTILEEKLKQVNVEDDFSAPYRGYNPEDHASSPAHDRLRTNAFKWMKRQLVFQPTVQSEVQRTFETIAKKLDLKGSEVTYVGIHHRRSPVHIAHFKKYHKKKPLKKAYFYDAMEEMRESYNNVAFLYISDDMNWGRSNIKVSTLTLRISFFQTNRLRRTTTELHDRHTFS